MTRANATWGEDRIAAELRLKLGLCVSPRTVRREVSLRRRPRDPVPSHRWDTFVRNHAGGVLACDFLVTIITAMFRTTVLKNADALPRTQLLRTTGRICTVGFESPTGISD